jgi:hypothetical protein
MRFLAPFALLAACALVPFPADAARPIRFADGD